jgi:hypothetical protein
MGLETAIETLGEAVRHAQDNAHALGAIRATILVNFGPTSLSKKRYGFEIPTEGPDNKDSTESLLIFVLRKLHERIEELGAKPTELQNFVAMLERTGMGHGTRDDYESGSTVLVELEQETVEFQFDNAGLLKATLWCDDDGEY